MINSALQMGVIASATGSSESATVDTTIAETEGMSAEAIGVAIGKGVIGQASQMGTIAEDVSMAGLTQQEAATAAETAVHTIGKGTAGIVRVGNNLIVTSRRLGQGQFVLIVDRDGIVSKGFATIEIDSAGNTIVSNVERANGR
jgi:hypothetical protein